MNTFWKIFEVSDNSWNIISFAILIPLEHIKSGKIGEDPRNIPNNLIPYITQVVHGKRAPLVYSAMIMIHLTERYRDYIHVTDLATGHIKALEKLKEKPGILAYNLGTGKVTVFSQMVKNFEK